MEGEVKTVVIDRFTDEDMKALADCVVVRSYEHKLNDQSMYDFHMGVCERGKICETCSFDWEKCVGGVGVLNLSHPYYFAANGKLITQLLQYVCRNCKTVIYPFDKRTLVEVMKRKVVKPMNCPSCVDGRTMKIIERKTKPDVDKTKWDTEFYEEAYDRVVPLQEIKAILDSVEHQWKLTSPIHPPALTSTLLNNRLLIPPVYTRPYTQKANQTHHHDISTIINSIVKEISKKTPTSHKDLYDRIEMLLTQRKSRPLPNSSKIPLSLQDKIQGKEGLINSSINGKRVNHSARANITGYPDGKLGEVGIPLLMANKMTVLTPASYASQQGLQTWLEENKPLRVRKKSGSVYRVSPHTQRAIFSNLQPEDMLERPIKNGDIVLFNRQPSLRPESIISMVAKIIDGIHTLRLVLPCTEPMNADFDGDECNLHILQDVRARTECHELMSPAEQIISSQKGIPIIVPVQDALIGSYLMTCDTCMIDREEVFDLCLMLDMRTPIDTLEERISIWNMYTTNDSQQCHVKNAQLPGKLIYSLIFNSYLNYTVDDVQIVNGVILPTSGPITKRTLCSGINSILHKYYFSLGKVPTCTLLDHIQRITNHYLCTHGFTIGLADCQLPEPNIHVSVDNVNTVLGKLEIRLGRQIDKSNNFYKIVKSGAKGSMTNVVQVGQLVGQQSIDGTMVKEEMRSCRTLACYEFDDTSVGRTGFVNSCFFKGLTKAENLFHAKAGRRGVADSVTKVAESGYMSKRICKFLENLVVMYSLAVCENDTGRIVMYFFGVDGMNPARMPADKGKKTILTVDELSQIMLSNSPEELACIITDARIGLAKPCFMISQLKTRIWSSLLHLLPHVQPCPIVTDVNNYAVRRVMLECLLHKRLFEPGTAIGLLTGTNFGEISSQLLLKSFHHTGIKNKDISGGIKRLNQLLNRTCAASESEIVCIARMKDDIYSSLAIARKLTTIDSVKETLKIFMEDRCAYLASTITSMRLEHIVQHVTFVQCNCINTTCTMFTYCSNVNQYSRPTIRYTIDVTRLEDCYFTLEDVCEKINRSSNEVHCVLHDTSIMATLNNQIIDEWLMMSTLVEVNKRLLVTEITSGAFDQCAIDYDESIEDFELIFKGVRLEKVLEIPFIDPVTVYSADPFEMLAVFGIEAARKRIFTEIMKVLTFDGADIDTRYVQLICEAMCVQGKITSIVNSSGVLTNSFFEKEIKKLNAHSITRSADTCKSVESAVFLGKVCKLGTGFFDLKEKPK